VTGTLSAPKADLIADFDSIDVPRLPLKDAHVVLSFAKRPDGGDGAASIEAGSQYGRPRGARPSISHRAGWSSPIWTSTPAAPRPRARSRCAAAVRPRPT
jgi:hypothetical protein